MDNETTRAGSELTADEPVGDRPGTADVAELADELLIEEISIDGMCGVY